MKSQNTPMLNSSDCEMLGAGPWCQEMLARLCEWENHSPWVSKPTPKAASSPKRALENDTPSCPGCCLFTHQLTLQTKQ